MEPAATYARFSRRLKALCLDAILFVLVFYVGAVVVHAISSSDRISRGLWFGLVLAVVLYEPTLVAMIGGTIGHRLTNLRVVDDRSKGNLTFPKALTRAAIKALLGWYSFLTMSLTRRNQALHDVLTHSTVQIRDASKARANHYVVERQVEAAPGILPSRARRVFVILVYIILGYVCLSAVSLLLVSDACAFQRRCSEFERAMAYVLDGGWLLLTACAVILGWKGRLLGCRIRHAAA